MSECRKCKERLGIFIEDENGALCIRCHPTAIGSGLSTEEIANKLPDNIFTKTKSVIY